MSKKNQKKNKQKQKGRRGGMPASSDLAMAAGRGPMVPRATLGFDTLLGLAQSQRRTLATAANVVLTQTAGAYVESTITLNSAYLPFGSNSPAGFAKYMAFYSKCFVVGSTLILKGVVVDNASTSGVITGVVVSTNNTTFANASVAIENGMCQWDVGFNIPDRFHFTESVDVKKFLNKPFVLDDPQLYCTVGAAPAQVIDAHIFSAAQSGSTSISVIYTFELLQDCVFTDPIPFT